MAYNIRKRIEIEPQILWYLVGLITADGSLSKDGRHVDITLKEDKVLQEIVKQIGLDNKITKKRGGTGTITHRVQISNKSFYDFLMSIGLMPNKSRNLEKLEVPRKHFEKFLRGMIDGDGAIKRWIHPSNRNEQWSLSIYSGAKTFIKWLQEEVEKNLGVTGKIHINSGKRNNNRVYVLKFGKMAAKRILQKCYQKDGFGLKRKYKAASGCLSSSTGWTRSKTLSDVPG